MRVFVSWSGGKDSCLALYRALKKGFKVEYIFNMLDEDGLKSRSHGLSKEVINIQAKALGIPIIFGKASWDAYEDEFKIIIQDLKNQGIEGGIFGDINIKEHRDWVERTCSSAGLKSFELLWEDRYDVLLNEFLDNNFEAVIISARKDLIDQEWVGQSLNMDFIEYLKMHNIDLCGENGEYHTFVTNGPIFKQRIQILESRRKLENNRCLLEILKIKKL